MQKATYTCIKTKCLPTLPIVDDIVSISKCGLHAWIYEVNVKTDRFVKVKELECQVGQGKCQWTLIGKQSCKSMYYANNSPTNITEK